jgi:uncharacterized protein
MIRGVHIMIRPSLFVLTALLALSIVLVSCGPSKQELNRRLIEAVKGGRITEARDLLERGADPNCMDGASTMRLTALMYSLERPEMLDLLLSKGADPNLMADEFTPLMMTPGVGSLESMKKLVAAGATVNTPGPNGAEALSIAAGSGDTGMVQFLIDHGARVNHQDNLGLTPLHHVVMTALAEGDQRKVVQILLKAGADRSIGDRKGRQPYFYASKTFFLRRKGGPEIAALVKPVAKAK